MADSTKDATCQVCGVPVPGGQGVYTMVDALEGPVTLLCRDCAALDAGAEEAVCGDDAPGRFERAWAKFGETCFHTVAPEATYQAWFAHFLMEEFDVLRVVREVDFGARYLDQEARDRFTGSNLMVDVMVLREPVVDLPRRAWLGPPVGPGMPSPRSGLARLERFAVISELKVASTQGNGLQVGDVVRDVHKLDAILRGARAAHPDAPIPVAYACVLSNNARHRLRLDQVLDRVGTELGPTPVRVLSFER